MMTQPSPENPLLAAALQCASWGLRVFPVHTPVDDGKKCSCSKAEDCTNIGKHPRTKNGLTDASENPDDIAGWWTQWPDANVGACTGDRYFVLDLDPRHGGQAPDGLPATRTAATGGGGQHLWFRKSIAIRNGANVLGPGVDVRGDGGYVLMPPSLHASGKRYSWENDVAAVEAPEWLQRSCAHRQRAAATQSDTPIADAFVEGGRNVALTSLGGSMQRKGFSLAAIEAALLEENRRRCRPSLDDREVARIASSVARYPANDPVNGESPPAQASILNAPQIAEPLGPVPWLCQRLELAPGPLSLLAGRGYGGKTVGAQALGLAVAAGKLAWGAYPMTQGRAVHLDYEQGSRLSRERYQRLARAMGLDLRDLGDDLQLMVFPDFYLDKNAGWDRLERLTEGAKLCILDAMRGFLPSIKENDSEIRRWLDPFGRLSERTGCVYLALHHARKQSENDNGGQEQTIRGSSAIFDACQSVFVVEASKGEAPIVHHEKARLTGKLEPDFNLVIADVSGPSDDPEQDGRPDTRWGLGVSAKGIPVAATTLDRIKAEVFALIDREPGISARALRQIPGKGVLIDEAIEQLEATGKIRIELGPKNGRKHFVSADQSAEDAFDEWNE